VAARIGAWEDEHDADFTNLASASVALSVLAILIQYIRNVKGAAEKAYGAPAPSSLPSTRLQAVNPSTTGGARPCRWYAI